MSTSHAIQRELTAGLLSDPPAISPKYLYDELGSRLFEAICALPEYYLTRTEAGIIAACGPQLAAAVGPGVTLVELGAGNCAKGAALFPLLQPVQYVPVDIAADFLQEAVDGLRQRFPDIAMQPVVEDFSLGLRLPDSVRRERRLLFYPGSSIGNFDPDSALKLLRQAHACCDADGALLLGFDLLKPRQHLHAAYDDALGITAAFNRNVLRHVNQLLDADFDPRQWRHVAAFSEPAARMEMHLEASVDQVVHWPGGSRLFRRGQRIHTENSYKFSLGLIAKLLAEAGFHLQDQWQDPQSWFALVLARRA